MADSRYNRDHEPLQANPDYCATCGAYIGEDGLIEQASDGLCVECVQFDALHEPEHGESEIRRGGGHD